MNRAIFLDRDGVINEHIYEVDGKVMSPAIIEQIKIKANVKEGISSMKNMGFKVICITNQPGVSFGYIDENKLKEMNNFLKKELGIDEVYYCPHGPMDECKCRKPKEGLVLLAKKNFNLDVSQSYMVGDSLSDIKTGQNSKVKKTFLLGVVREDILYIQHKNGIFPDYTLPDLVAISEKIRELEGLD